MGSEEEKRIQVKHEYLNRYIDEGFITWCAMQIRLSPSDGTKFNGIEYKKGKKIFAAVNGFTKFDEQECSFHWEDNKPTVCINTGKVSNLIVFDFDDINEYDRFMKDHPELNGIRKTKTNKGYHLYFKYRNGFTSHNDVLFSYKNVDVKTNGGFVFAAPTSYNLLDEEKTLFSYELIEGEILDCPDFLLEDYNKKKESKAVKKVVEPLGNVLVDEPVFVSQQNSGAPDLKLVKYYEEIIDDGLLDHCSSNYSDWVDIGLCFKTFGVFDLFERFSKRCPSKYSSDNCQKMWNGFKPVNKTTATVLFQARKNTSYPGSRLNKRDIIEIDKKKKEEEKEQKKKEKEEEKVQKFINSNYKDVKARFELTHAKIGTMGFIKEKNRNGDITFEILNRTQILNGYEEMKYEEDGKGKSFIKKWLDDENKRQYSEINCYPNDSKCPEDVYNSWQKFKMEHVPNYKYKEEELQVVLKHIKVLCCHEKQVYDYFLDWLGQAIQYPEIKVGTAPVFISGEGCGKGEFILLLRNILGNKKVMETTSPERDLWGPYMGDLADAYIVNCNEIEKRYLIGAKGKIKGLLTDSTMVVNVKFQPQYTKNSYHRFIFTTNEPEPMNTAEGDRRFFFIRSSDEFVGNAEYHAYFRKIIEDVDVQKTFYEYLKNIKGLENFHKRPVPETAYHKELKKMGKTPEEQFLEHLCTLEGKTKKFTGAELLREFNDFCANQGIEWKVTSVQLGVRIGNLVKKHEKVPDEILKNTHKREGVIKEFNLAALRKRLDPTSFVDE